SGPSPESAAQVVTIFMTDAGLRAAVAFTDASRPPPSSCTTSDSDASGNRVARHACWTSGGNDCSDCAGADRGTQTLAALAARTPALIHRFARKRTAFNHNAEVMDIGNSTAEKLPA